MFYSNSGETWALVNRFNQTNGEAVVTPTDRPKSVRNRYVIEVFGGVFVLSVCFSDFSVVVGAFVIELRRISSFFLFSSKLLGQVYVRESLKSFLRKFYG